MMPVFLIGGGWRVETFPQTYGRFLEAADENNQRRIAIVVAEEPEVDPHDHFLRFFSAFELIGLSPNEAFEIAASAENPLTREKIGEIEPTGVFVCGGLTPAYADALCVDKSWLAHLTENKIPYCGFSAGAAIAADRAIIGGWQRKIEAKAVEITNENAGEDLAFLDVRAGLGLVPFTIDVHATQWGTLSRLVHAVDARLTARGWAIDDNTMLEIIDEESRVCGAGNAYCVRRQNERIAVDVFQA